MKKNKTCPILVEKNITMFNTRVVTRSFLYCEGFSLKKNAHPKILCEMYEICGSTDELIFVFLYFKRANIFSFIDFLTQIVISQCFVWCVLSHQGDYSEFHFYHKSLNTPLMILKDEPQFRVTVEGLSRV